MAMTVRDTRAKEYLAIEVRTGKVLDDEGEK